MEYDRWLLVWVTGGGRLHIVKLFSRIQREYSSLVTCSISLTDGLEEVVQLSKLPREEMLSKVAYKLCYESKSCFLSISLST